MCVHERRRKKKKKEQSARLVKIPNCHNRSINQSIDYHSPPVLHARAPRERSISRSSTNLPPARPTNSVCSNAGKAILSMLIQSRSNHHQFPFLLYPVTLPYTVRYLPDRFLCASHNYKGLQASTSEWAVYKTRLPTTTHRKTPVRFFGSG